MPGGSSDTSSHPRYERGGGRTILDLLMLKLQSEQCALHSFLGAVHREYVVYSVQCLVYTVQCLVHTVQYLVCTAEYLVCTEQYLVCSAQCLVCSVQLYT